MISFEQEKQQVAEKHGYASWSSVVQNLVGDAYITTLDRTKRDRKKFLEMEAKAAELYARHKANEAVKEDRARIFNESFYEPHVGEQVVLVDVTVEPLPYPDEK